MSAAEKVVAHMSESIMKAIGPRATFTLAAKKVAAVDGKYSHVCIVKWKDAFSKRGRLLTGTDIHCEP